MLVLVSDEPSMGGSSAECSNPHSHGHGYRESLHAIRCDGRPASDPDAYHVPDRITATAANSPWLVGALLIDLMAGPQRRIHAAMRRGDCPIGRRLANRTRSGRMALAHRSPVRERAMFSAFIGVEWHSSHRKKAGDPASSLPKLLSGTRQVDL